MKNNKKTIIKTKDNTIHEIENLSDFIDLVYEKMGIDSVHWLQKFTKNW